MKEHLQEIEDDQDILILTGPKKRDYVVLTLEQFNSMEETTHLMSTQANTERLLESTKRVLEEKNAGNQLQNIVYHGVQGEKDVSGV